MSGGVVIAIEVAGSLLARLTWSNEQVTPAKYRSSKPFVRGSA
jgi:hypothetical protein